MAVIYDADTYAASQAITDAGLGVNITETFSRVMSTTALLITDQVRLAKIPAGAIITDWSLVLPAMDSNAVLRLSLGLGGNANLDNTGAVLAAATLTAYLSSSAFGGAGAAYVGPMMKLDVNGANPIASAAVAGALPSAALTCNQDLVLSWTVAGTGTVAGGTLKGSVTYHMHYPAAVF